MGGRQKTTGLLGEPAHVEIQASDGRTMAAVTDRGYSPNFQTHLNGILILSTDSGASWTKYGPLGSGGFALSSVALMGPGTRILVTSLGGTIQLGSEYQVPGYGATFSSNDSGRDWQQSSMTPRGRIVAASPSGDHLVLLEGGQLWTFSVATRAVPVTVEAVAGDANAAIELQYIGSGKYRTLSREGNISY